jgi:hypothetical protein
MFTQIGQTTPSANWDMYVDVDGGAQSISSNIFYAGFLSNIIMNHINFIICYLALLVVY